MQVGPFEERDEQLKVLVLFMGQGAGPRTAAEAVAGALSQRDPTARVHLADVCDLDETGVFQWGMSTHVEHMYRSALGMRVSRSLRLKHRLAMWMAPRWSNKLVTKAVRRVLEQESWDVVINTSTNSAYTVADARQHGWTDVLNVWVTVDFGGHPIRVVDPCERIMVASPTVEDALLGLGARPEQLVLSGIPVREGFSARVDQEEARRSLGIPDDDRPLILLTASGWFGQVPERLEALCRCREPLRILAIAGSTAAAANQVAALHGGEHDITVIERIEDMPAAMAAADLVITKPGGLTAAEALCSGCGLILTDPLPPIETGNADYLYAQGAAVPVYDVSALPHVVERVLRTPGKLGTMRANALAAARPEAADTIAQVVMDLVRERADSGPLPRWSAQAS